MKCIQIFASFLFVVIASAAYPAIADGMSSVTIKTQSGDRVWQIELASDDDSRSRGLMFRKSMAAETGMLFRFETTRPVAMWMKNTFIPLDMIFADEAGRVTHIHKGAVPHSLEVISSQGPARYVLEINAGEADLHGVDVGNQLRHPWILPSN